MNTLTTNGVIISVETFYQASHSNPAKNQYFFAYTINITNSNHFSIQILRRHWIIKDALMQVREVQGEGVVGVQPVLLPNQSFEYTSGCDFQTEMGRMSGYYLARNLITDTDFYIDIPSFIMCIPSILN